MLQVSRIVLLITKRQNNDITSAESTELDSWINASEANKKFVKRFLPPDLPDIMFNTWAQLDDDAFDKKIRQAIKSDTPAASIHIGGKYHLLIQRTIQVAAAIIAVVLVWIVVTFVSHSGTGDPTTHGRRTFAAALAELPLPTKLPAASRHPVLYFSDNSRCALEDLRIGRIIQKDGWQIIRTDSTTIAYQQIPEQMTHPSSTQAAWHTLSVPYGKSWSIQLPDGSSTQLSTGTTLAYRVDNSPQETYPRVAVLRGQAYFDIIHNKDHPYQIKTDKSLITVLGTRLDICDYSGDKFLATLLEGKIQVENQHSSVTLKPAEQAIFEKNQPGILHAVKADTAASTDWRRPSFRFTGCNIVQVMKQIVDWYGLDSAIISHDIDTTTPDLLGWGHAAKDLPLPVFLQQIKTDSLDFEIRDRTILVLRP